jgi:hypothetical protein
MIDIHRLIIAPTLIISLICAWAVNGCRSKSDEPKKANNVAATAPTVGDQKPSTTQQVLVGHPVVEQAEPLPPPPALQLNIELGWDDPYVGEPLVVRLYLSSPRADALLDAASATSASVVRPVSPLSTVSVDWPAAVHLLLFRVTDGQPGPAAIELDWSKLRLPNHSTALGNPFAQWEIPLSANLPAGEYLLRATWAGKDLIESSALEMPELMSETRFQISTPHNGQEIAAHAERIALLAYREGKFSETRHLAEEAVKADPQSTTPHRFEMLLAQTDACLAMDDWKAGLAVYRSMLKMSMDDRMAADMNLKVKVLEKLVAKPK